MKTDNIVTYTRPTEYYSIAVCELMLDACHVLIGGATGSGKSVLIDDFIYTIMAKYTPHDAHIFFIDPKKVTFVKYRHLPFVEQIETEPTAILGLLEDMAETMDNRYREMSARGIVQYDGKHIFIIIDEIADLMTNSDYKKQYTRLIQRLAQMGRASNIHLICATQCPNRKIIPAELTVNFLGRVALRCLDSIESRQIIKKKGAETLPRWGKCIYLHADSFYYDLDIPFMEDRINGMIKFWLAQGTNKAIFTTQEQKEAKQTGIKGDSSFFDWLRGTKRIKEKKQPTAKTDFELLNILSIIDDD